MKKLFIIVVIAFGVFFAGCEKEMESMEPMEPENDIGILKKAGTNYSDPNTFDAAGNLLYTGGTYNTQDSDTPMELWMGVGNAKAGTLVGHVTFLTNPDPDGLPGLVRIDLQDFDGDEIPDMYPYLVNVAHIHFASDVTGIPRTKKGNPIPGKFEYNVDVDPLTTVIEIPVEFDAVGAIHLAVSTHSGIQGFNLMLPNDEVTMRITPINSSYVKLQVKDAGFISEYDGGLGAGYYEGWCFAKDLSIRYNRDYSAYLYSSYEDIPENVLTRAKIIAENLDNANYLMNTYSVGDEIFDGTNPLGVLRVTDLQNAIWNLIHDKYSTLGNAIAEFLAADALLNGDGFVPGCDQKIIFLAVPSDGDGFPDAQLIIGQPIIGQLPVPCEILEGGTAWGDGYYGATFPGSKQWGTYFNYESN
jgi:hypothetical protein